MSSLWEGILELPIINPNLYNTTSNWYEDGTISNIKNTYKDKNVRIVPKDTVAYKKIIAYWDTKQCLEDKYLNLFSWIHAIEIVEGNAPPVESIHVDAFKGRILNVSQEWLRNFLNDEDFAELAAKRMLGASK